MWETDFKRTKGNLGWGVMDLVTLLIMVMVYKFIHMSKLIALHNLNISNKYIVCQLKPLEYYYDKISPELRMGKWPMQPFSPTYGSSQNLGYKWPPTLSVHKVTFNILSPDLS